MKIRTSAGMIMDTTVLKKTGFRLNNNTEKHSTIGSGGGMKTKWREKKSAEIEEGLQL